MPANVGPNDHANDGPNDNATDRPNDHLSLSDPFSPGEMVMVTLNTPREKFWGALLAVTPAGISMRGVDLNSFEDFTRQLKAGEPVTAHAVFFPMHRIERVEVDARNGEIPSMQERFADRVGRGFRAIFLAGAER